MAPPTGIGSDVRINIHDENGFSCGGSDVMYSMDWAEHAPCCMDAIIADEDVTTIEAVKARKEAQRATGNFLAGGGKLPKPSRWALRGPCRSGFRGRQTSSHGRRRIWRSKLRAAYTRST